MSDQTVAGFCLSTQQERTWSQHAAYGAAFWTECELAIAGPLEAEKLQGVIGETVGRHEILRTVFHRQTGVTVPFQVILESPHFVWQFADLAGLEASAQSEKLSELVRGREAVIDVEKGPVLHAVLARFSSDEHRLVLSLPALCADLISMQNLAAEITRSYSGASDPPAEVMQYADVAAWQQELLASDESKAARDYWREYGRKLDFGALEAPLSGFEKRPATEPVLAAVEREFELPLLGVPAGAQMDEFLFTAWLVFLSRMTGCSGLTVGCHFEGRSYSELANALGPFARVLPFSVECSGNVVFADLLSRVHLGAAEFRKWQDSFTWHNLGRPAGQSQSATLPFAFEYAELAEPTTIAGQTFRMLRNESCNELFAVRLSARLRGGQLQLRFQFDAGRVGRDVIERWSNHFVTLLFAAIADPTMLTNRLPLLDRDERERLVVDWNQTGAEYPRERCIHELFEAQVARTPDAPAVRYEDDCLTYEELNHRANQLAHHLTAKGVGAGSLVGLCLERSCRVMVAVLGILKAGGAYVPLSADHPKPRLALQLAGAAALITESRFECVVPAFGGPTILLDRNEDEWSHQPVTNPRSGADSDGLVYVIYTSGSTGTPKGVAVRHRNLVNYTTFIQNRLELQNHSGPLQFATVSTLGADLGNTCIYPSLVSGGCLHIIGYDVAADSQRLREYMAKHPVDVLKIVPSHLQALMIAGGGREVLPRKYLILGGEPFTLSLLEKIVAANASCEVLNHYGPTETTVGSLTLRLSEFDIQKSLAQTIPIGKPIANTRIYVLDPEGEPVPIGVAGELYIGGDGVASGYVGQPKLTDERFSPEHFVLDPESKMYRTGDLVRYLADGNVEFLGRADDQVKIRGFRIELGEVEAILAKHSGVAQSAVLALSDERGEKSLIAYVVGTASPDDLRTYLRGQLPDYMVPAAIIELPKMPLNANGKIDRLALPKPDDVKAASKEALAPRTPSEEVVAAIWVEVLKREDIGVDDNFFEIGGHSLLATQIAARLREHFGIPVPVRAIFELPSVAQLARRMDTARREDQGMLPPPITPVPRNGKMPLSYAQERLWVLDQIEPDNPLYNIPRALRLRGTLNADALERALNEIVRRHESQRTTFEVRDGIPVQVIVPSLEIPLVLHDLSSLAKEIREAEAERLAVAEAQRPFDLKQAPLVRAHLFRLAPEDYVLQLTMHHIVSDAWSAGLFLQELTVLYQAFSAGNPSPLPALSVQYADYAVQERSWLQGKVLEKQLAFWRERLKGIPAVVALPLDRERPESRTFAGACEMFHVPSEKVALVKDLARREGATLFMTLMAAFQAMLAKYSGEDQIVVGTDLANRMMPETEGMIGFFINLLAVRTDLSGNPTFRELLRRVREGLLESYAHQEVPFPKIVQEVQPERSATHNPIVQVLFVMQNVPRARRELAGLHVEPFELPITTSKFDMAVFVADRPEGLVGYWVYSTELFEQATIQRMARHFCNLLDSAVSQPDARLSALAMLSADEMAQQAAERKQRKQSQIGKLRATAPSEVGIAGTSKGKEQ